MTPVGFQWPVRDSRQQGKHRRLSTSFEVDTRHFCGSETAFRLPGLIGGDKTPNLEGTETAGDISDSNVAHV